MVKEDFYRDTEIFKLTHNFGEIRQSERWGIYYHGGDDLISIAGKNQNLFNLIDGSIYSLGSGRDYGKYLLTKHNPKFINGVDDVFYGLYCHMSEIEDRIIEISETKYKFINSGSIIGKMGNTGNCWTKGSFGKYRMVTEKEVTDKNSLAGVHVHQQFHQITESEKETPLLLELKRLGIIKKDSSYYYFWQWGKLFYNPSIIMSYFKYLQGRKR